MNNPDSDNIEGCHDNVSKCRGGADRVECEREKAGIKRRFIRNLVGFRFLLLAHLFIFILVSTLAILILLSYTIYFSAEISHEFSFLNCIYLRTLVYEIHVNISSERRGGRGGR